MIYQNQTTKSKVRHFTKLMVSIGAMIARSWLGSQSTWAPPAPWPAWCCTPRVCPAYSGASCAPGPPPPLPGSGQQLRLAGSCRFPWSAKQRMSQLQKVNCMKKMHSLFVSYIQELLSFMKAYLCFVLKLLLELARLILDCFQLVLARETMDIVLSFSFLNCWWILSCYV